MAPWRDPDEGDSSRGGGSKVMQVIQDCGRMHSETRWISCFVVAVLAHAAGALCFSHRSVSPEFGIDAPVVALELPESFLLATAPPTDLAPDAKQEDSEVPPAAAAETKPSDPEVAAVLPDPPSPQQPQEQKRATAPPAAAFSIVVVRRWESELVAHIERFKRYPANALARADQGLVRIAFTIDREGWVRASRIVQSSGLLELDQEAFAMLTRAQPLPRPPERVPADALTYTVPVRFNIR